MAGPGGPGVRHTALWAGEVALFTAGAVLLLNTTVLATAVKIGPILW